VSRFEYHICVAVVWLGVFAAVWTLAGCHVHLHYHPPARQASQSSDKPHDPDTMLDWAIGDLMDEPDPN